MRFAAVDIAVLVGYFAVAIGVGLLLRRRAGRDVEQYFLSGRSLPWWIAGTSMVATSFAADTPLLVSGWVRDLGIWKNWVWWCYALSGLLGVFLFARWWRRSGVMTKAELAELRYGGSGARNLRATLGVVHTLFTNPFTLAWVLVAAGKILEVLFGFPKVASVLVACAIAMSYSLLAGFWGVVITDLVQFAISVVGAVALAVICWQHVGGLDGILGASPEVATLCQERMRMFPATGGAPLGTAFWTTSMASFAIYLGIAWWASESVDGSGTMVQRICASRDERQGRLAVLWFLFAHYALRPWPWIAVALASLVLLPPVRIDSPATGEVVATSAASIELLSATQKAPISVPLTPVDGDDWRPRPRVQTGDLVEEGQLLAQTDEEMAYVVMVERLLPAGLFGLVVVSLLAAFMSTIDTHVNLAASYFLNDIYRRFIAPTGRSDAHYVLVSRLASLAIITFAALIATRLDSLSEMFQFFLAFLAGVGPVALLRWIWWRVTATTEIVALLASGAATLTLTVLDSEHAWSLGPLTHGGDLTPAARQLFVVAISASLALAVTLLGPRPDPGSLVEFYRRVRPPGAWGPVAALVSDARPSRAARDVAVGVPAGLALLFGALFAIGFALFGRPAASLGAAACAAAGGFGVWWVLRSGANPEQAATIVGE